MKRLILLFSVSVLLTVQHLEAQTAVTDTVFLQLYNDSVDLKEVVVKGKKTPVANSRWSDMSPVELVTVGGANGDLYQALQTLPGTQYKEKVAVCWCAAEVVMKHRHTLTECTS